MCIPKRRIRESIHCVDPAGVEERARTTIRWRRYHVDAPNEAWHMDGNHKLIQWKFVFHSCMNKTVVIALIIATYTSIKILQDNNLVVNRQHNKVNCGNRSLTNCGHDIVNGGHDIVNGGHDIVNGGHDIVNGGHDIVNVGHDIVNGGHDIVNRGHNIIIVNCVLNMVNCGSLTPVPISIHVFWYKWRAPIYECVHCVCVQYYASVRVGSLIPASQQG